MALGWYVSVTFCPTIIESQNGRRWFLVWLKLSDIDAFYYSLKKLNSHCAIVGIRLNIEIQKSVKVLRMKFDASTIANDTQISLGTKVKVCS